MSSDNLNKPEADDSDLFRRMMHGVKPLKIHQHQTIPITIPKQTSPQTAIPTPRRLKLKLPPIPYFMPLSSSITEELSAECILFYKKKDLSLKQFQSLKKGDIPRQACLDLHGLSRDKARDAMTRFMAEQTSKGHRCVIIIHGKGEKHSHYSILKSHVNHWLKQFPAVLAFHSARPQHGGTGAVYVLLSSA